MSNTKPRPALIPIDELSRRLSARAAAIVADLYGIRPRGGRVMLDELTGGEGTHISINLTVRSDGALPGSFYDFRSKKGGDILELVAIKKFGGNRGEACKWAMGYLGLTPPPRETEEQRIARLVRDAAETKRLTEKMWRDQAKADADRVNTMRLARSIFLNAQADIINTPVARYLMDERGIDISQLPSTGSCRFDPDCLLHETGEVLPAMVLCVANGGGLGGMTAVHRTYLEQVNGLWRVIRRPNKKGEMKALRLCLGLKKGGHVSVAKGSSEVPLARAPQGDGVVVAEGYESALRFVPACPGLRVISGLDLGNMFDVVMPRTITRRYFSKENGMSEQAEETFWKGIKKQQQECDDVRVIETPQGFSDPDDFMRDKKMVTR